MKSRLNFDFKFHSSYKKLILLLYAHSGHLEDKNSIENFILGCINDIAKNDFMIDYRKKDKDGFVYIMEDNSGLFKIGFSKNPNDRLYQFQTGNPKISIYNSYPANKLDEKLLHKLFQKKRDCGEWFRLKPKHLKWIENYFINQNQ